VADKKIRIDTIQKTGGQVFRTRKLEMVNHIRRVANHSVVQEKELRVWLYKYFKECVVEFVVPEEYGDSFEVMQERFDSSFRQGAQILAENVIKKFCVIEKLETRDNPIDANVRHLFRISFNGVDLGDKNG